MHSKLLGSILLITGTSIGAGMLGLPIAAPQLGFMGSVILLVSIWAAMLMGALFLLEVNLWLPPDNNIITMARATIGPVGQLVAWGTYLLLLYSLLCAYISGGSHLFQDLLATAGINAPLWLASITFTALFGFIVYLGVKPVDHTNRVLMLVKFTSYFLLILLLLPFISLEHLSSGSLRHLTSASAITVTVTSFGWAVLVPTLRVYFNGDLKQLKRAVFIGSLVPLVIYILWDAVVMGVIPLQGAQSLTAIQQSADTTGSLVNTIISLASTGTVATAAKIFTSICVLTSFLGVALCLTDFFADGLGLKKRGMSGLLIMAVTFVPALAVAIFVPNVFITALEYAGLYCLILLLLLPIWMTWCGRYRRELASGFMVPGKKIALMLMLVCVAVLLALGVT